MKIKKFPGVLLLLLLTGAPASVAGEAPITVSDLDATIGGLPRRSNPDPITEFESRLEELQGREEKNATPLKN